MVSLSVAFYVSEWAIRLAMLVVAPRRRRPPSTMAWLLVIFFLPWPGLALYLLIGRSRLARRRVAKYARLRAKLESVGARIRDSRNGARPAIDPRLEQTVTLAERLGFMPILGGNEVALMSRTESFINRLIDDIDAARDHVHLLFYIYAADATGRRVADALARAVGRGVQCRVLVDAVGSRSLFKVLGARMRQDGVDLRAALPVNLFRRQMNRIDLRNHRKLAVVDGRIGYTGSQNIVDADYGHKDLAWRDVMARLTGPVVLELQSVFLEDWHFETEETLDDASIFPDPPQAGDASAQVLPSGPNFPTENYQRMVVAALYAARERVVITTPYYVPDEAFSQALEVAVLRGVEVTVIVPRRCDRIIAGAATSAYFEALLDAGVHLFLYDDGLLHSKTMTIDSAMAFLGTGNFDIRSFALNFEISLVLYGARETADLRALQDRYVARSTRLEADEWSARAPAKKVFQNAAKLLSPLL